MVIAITINDSKSGNEDDVLSDPSFGQVVFWLLTFSVIQSIVIFIGHLVNQRMSKHR